MAYVVTESCIRCKYTDCVEVCPVDCFHEGPNFMVIDPVGCIDCSLCEPECPANAIYAADAVPPEYEHYVELNARLSGSWPVLKTRKEPLPEADVWLELKDKFGYLERVNGDDTVSSPGPAVQARSERRDQAP